MLRLGLVCVRQFMSVSMCATVCINWSRRHLTEGFSPQKPLTMAGLQLGSVCACVAGAWNFTRTQINCFLANETWLVTKPVLYI